ncbi:DUF2066 domain-containing protein [Plesiomonas shigelloides]|uniref:DUF2066 domain-containing protein n=1 Tax=Plesiomonas shigelloides TaxID=703 RepID=UPI000E00FA07|nr:DUF2066 domain-containing protein [Plesiomonas shigelloides]QIY09585.1 DUF2066 domain-containing protein [Plesiomonas shigelloides]SUB62803.1 Uncharacterized protein conserved in bacteria (DUF2066) [Plesiomonas shigelloides]
MRIKPIVAWTFLLLAGGVQAAEVNDFYLVRLPVSGAQLTDAQRSEALDDMLIRYSGLRELPASSALQSAQQQAGRYIAQTQTRNENGEKTADVSFDPAAVQHLAQTLGLPVWNHDRPAIMLWLVDNRGNNSAGDRRIMLDQEYSAAREQLRQVAMERGIPLLLPLGDLEDNMAVSASDVYGNFINPIAAASLRYQPDAVLVASLNNDSLTWHLYDAAPDKLQTSLPQSQEYTLPGAPDQTVGEMLEQVADYYAKKARDAATPATAASASIAPASTVPVANSAPAVDSAATAVVAPIAMGAASATAATTAVPTTAVPITGPQETSVAGGTIPANVPATATAAASAAANSVTGSASADGVLPTAQLVQQDMQAQSALPDASSVSGYAGTVMRSGTTPPPASAISPQMSYPSTPLADNQYALVVAGITSPDQLTQLSKRLKALTAATDVQMIGLAGSEVEYHMVMKGSRADLEKELAAAGSLKMDAGNAAQGKVLKYQWGS